MVECLGMELYTNTTILVPGKTLLDECLQYQGGYDVQWKYILELNVALWLKYYPSGAKH